MPPQQPMAVPPEGPQGTVRSLPSLDSTVERIRPSLQVVRYRGFVLIPQGDLTWLIRPERSPMKVLPFRAPASSLSDVKAIVDWRLDYA